MTYTERRNNPFAQYADWKMPPKPERADPSSPPAKDAKAMAAAIIRAGKVARGEIVEDTRPPVGSLGRAILDAAAKARGGS